MFQAGSGSGRLELGVGSEQDDIAARRALDENEANEGADRSPEKVDGSALRAAVADVGVLEDALPAPGCARGGPVESADLGPPSRQAPVHALPTIESALPHRKERAPAES